MLFFYYRQPPGVSYTFENVNCMIWIGVDTMLLRATLAIYFGCQVSTKCKSAKDFSVYLQYIMFYMH